jgi:hypothetical protein
MVLWLVCLINYLNFIPLHGCCLQGSSMPLWMVCLNGYLNCCPMVVVYKLCGPLNGLPELLYYFPLVAVYKAATMFSGWFA